jgi:hypothetical protein
MASLAMLRKRLEQTIEQGGPGDRQYLELRRQKRIDFIDQAYELGGRGFLDRVKAFACTEKGDKIELLPWYEEYCLLIGDLRLHHTMTTGCSQIGKTLAHTFLIVDCLTTGKLNAAWFYDTRTNLDQNVPMQFHPVVGFWVSEMRRAGHRFRRGRDRVINTRYQIDQANAIFSYTSTSRPSIRKGGGAAAGGAVVSFQADLMFLEERSQYTPGSADPLPRRLDASMLPTKPVRELGTPGGGRGIESVMTDVDRYFYPHFSCDHCGLTQPLDPKGCLLKRSVVRDLLGRPAYSYFSESGRPREWWHIDPNDPVGTAYLGCSRCGHPIDDEQRYEAKFRCRLTREWAADFIESLPPGIPDRRWQIGIHLSPLSRKRQGLASEIIQSGLAAAVTQDWQQQMLGHPSESAAANITMEMLIASMKAPKIFDRKPNFVLAGIDVGRAEDCMMIAEFYLPDDYRQMKPVEVYEKSIRNVIFGGAIVRTQIPQLLSDYGVQFGLIDNEPSRESSMEMCRKTCLELGDQVHWLKEMVSEATVQDGGISAKCWSFRSERFIESMLFGFLGEADDGYPIYRLPDSWEKWLGNPSELSPLVHLSGPYRDEDGIWHRAKGNVDDIFMSGCFMEVAFYLQLLFPQRYGSGSSNTGKKTVRTTLSDL